MGSGASKRKVNVVCCGLDNSGKTTIINHLKPKKAQLADIVPTVGFSVESFRKAGLSFTCFDMSGQGRYRNLWEHYYKDVNGIIFVIDSADKIRMCIVQEELKQLLNHADVKPGVPVLFLCNKKDKKEAMNIDDVEDSIQIRALCHNRPFKSFASNGLTGEGIEEGVQWLSTQLSKKL